MTVVEEPRQSRSPRAPDLIGRTSQPSISLLPPQLRMSNPPTFITGTTLVDQHLPHHQPPGLSTSSCVGDSARLGRERRAGCTTRFDDCRGRTPSVPQPTSTRLDWAYIATQHFPVAHPPLPYQLRMSNPPTFIMAPTSTSTSLITGTTLVDQPHPHHQHHPGPRAPALIAATTRRRAPAAHRCCTYSSAPDTPPAPRRSCARPTWSACRARPRTP
jgi:hypothetical protein